MRHLLFIDLTKNRQVVELPSYFLGQLMRAELQMWNFEGFDKDLDHASGIDKGPYYIQLKFIDFLDTKTVTDSSSPEMVPLPITSFNGWKPASQPFNMPLGEKKLTKTRFIVETYGPGKAPDLLTFPHPSDLLDTVQSHVILWIMIETEEDRPYYC